MTQRPIKFRAWDGKQLRRVEQWDFRDPQGVDVRGADGKGEYLSSSFPVVMQFTGLHDKNGKEIWEGDVVKIRETNHKGGYLEYTFETVEWQEYRFTPFDSAPTGICEVIGNIYQNPESLTK